MNIEKRRDMLRVRDHTLSVLEKSKDPETLRVLLVGIAKALQETLSLPSTREIIPKAKALECLMRAVAFEAEGNPMRESYPADKAQIGLDMLRS